MKIPTIKEISLQYKGYLSTPQLWAKDDVFEIEQIGIPEQNYSSYSIVPKAKLRLGKLVEQFVFHDLKQNSDITILKENIQIRKDKITIGELDGIILQNSIPTHLEIVFKFYLYDPSVGEAELENWIGPNRNDSLVHKLTKIQEKQFPILYHPSTQETISDLDIKLNNIEQKVLFKAQLFTPYSERKQQYNLINNNCIIGFYINSNELNQFVDYEFFIPYKLDWLIEPHDNVDWISYDEFRDNLNPLLADKRAPLCWMKKQNTAPSKFFVTWWDSKPQEN